jgi:WD40 repeat protein
VVWAVAIAPDGSWLATASSDGAVRTWDAATGKLRATLKVPNGALRAVAIAPDGSWLATTGDTIARIWDPATGQARALMRVENPIGCCAWLGTGALFVGGSRGLYLFDFLTDAAASQTSPPKPASPATP